MELLDNDVRRYPWGSTFAIPELLGIPGDDGPQAELWLGAHPAAPSRLRRAGAPVRLDAAVAADPAGLLGARVRRRFGDRLPFLLKVLAADSPLSLQVHPSQDQAGSGYAAEEAAGVPVHAPHRTYRDPHHKPEMVVAVTGFEALCGFRDPVVTADLLTGLGVPALERLVRPLAAGTTDGLRQAFTTALTDPVIAQAVGEVVAACARRSAAGSPYPAEDATTVALGAAYPGDPGVVVSLLLNRVDLAPGEALFLAAGNVHAYLRGLAVEVMAGSDNVLRGGLTGKHVDVPGLLATVVFEPQPVPYVVPEVGDRVTTWRTAAEEFQLVRVEVDGHPVHLDDAGPRIALCLRGTTRLRPASGGELELTRGQSAFVADADGELVVAGAGTVLVAGVRAAADPAASPA